MAPLTYSAGGFPKLGGREEGRGRQGCPPGFTDGGVAAPSLSLRRDRKMAGSGFAVRVVQMNPFQARPPQAT
jgi:hypothetical protein